ncbi:sporulation protein [Bacillus sp. SCS-153A]|uniref:sporulation protein n=1 Tax=Rossellomorea sedimentorum TaxID=3115294 RepID=UPI00390605F1
MWKEFLSSIGIGNIKVDTVVENPVTTPSSELKGEVVIEGGMSDQQVNKIVLTVFIRTEDYREDSDFSYHEKELHGYALTEVGVVKAEEEKRIPFKFSLSKEHPLTDDKTETFLRTTVDIPQAVDPTDEDSIKIVKSL